MASTTQDGETPWKRPDEHLIAEAYQYLFTSSLSRDRLRVNAGNGTLLPQKFEFGDHGLVGRSLAWKTFLTPVPPLTSELSPRPVPPLAEVRRRRQEYVDALKELMRAPDGNYAEGFTLPGQSRPPTPILKQGEFEKNNPLSLDAENPWKKWFENVELRKTILQDVQRTFPDLSYFREPQVQSDMTNVLFLHAATHSDIGYRQGMHELLASIFLAIDYDSLDKWTTSVQEKDLLELCDRTWLAADAWALFGVVMEAVNPWYEWREPAGSQKKQAEDGLHPYAAPVVAICNRIQNQYLSNVDPTLWRQMNELGIEPQLYGIRWLRLLFTREFGFKESMILWDGLFAMDSTLNLANWICVAMLVRIRNQLIPADYSEQLTYLLRYPSSSENGPLHVSLLLQQAIRLSQEPNASTGASIVVQNRNILNFPIEVPEPPAPPTSRRRTDRVAHIAAKSTTHARDASQSGFPEMLARNIMDKGESLGINRAIFNTVSELRKNLPDIQGAFAARSNSSSSVTSLPSLSYAQNVYDNDSASPASPSWEPPKPRFPVNDDMIAMQAQQMALSRAMAWSLDALMMRNLDGLSPLQREAFDCLIYVRNVLSQGKVVQLDENQLKPVSTESSTPPTNSAPQPQPNRENHSQTNVALSAPPTEPESPRVMLSKRDSKPVTGLTRTPQVPLPPAAPKTSVAPSTSRNSSAQKGTTFSAPATMNRYASSHVSPSSSRPSPPWQHTPPPSSAESRNLREHQRGDSVQAFPFKPDDTAQLSTSTYPSPSGYPPKRADSHPPSARIASINVDPLGVLK